MRYFETSLPLNEVKSIVEKAVLDFNKDSCIASLKNDTRIVASAHRGLDRELASNLNFKEIQMSEPQKIAFAFIDEDVTLYSGNENLFFN